MNRFFFTPSFRLFYDYSKDYLKLSGNKFTGRREDKIKRPHRTKGAKK